MLRHTSENASFWMRKDDRVVIGMLFTSAVIAMLLIALIVMPARGADIAGQVIAKGGAPAAGQLLQVVNQAGANVAAILSDGAGRYSFHDIAPGTYTLTLNQHSAVVYVPEDGLTVNWGLAGNLPPVAIAKQGVAIPTKVHDAPGPAPK